MMDFHGIEIVESPAVPDGWIMLRSAREIIAACPTGDGTYRLMAFQIPSPFDILKTPIV